VSWCSSCLAGAGGRGRGRGGITEDEEGGNKRKKKEKKERKKKGLLASFQTSIGSYEVKPTCPLSSPLSPLPPPPVSKP